MNSKSKPVFKYLFLGVLVTIFKNYPNQAFLSTELCN